MPNLTKDKFLEKSPKLLNYPAVAENSPKQFEREKTREISTTTQKLWRSLQNFESPKL